MNDERENEYLRLQEIERLKSKLSNSEQDMYTALLNFINWFAPNKKTVELLTAYVDYFVSKTGVLNEKK